MSVRTLSIGLRSILAPGAALALTFAMTAAGGCAADTTGLATGADAAPPPPDATPPVDAAPPPDAVPACEDQTLTNVTGHHAVRYDYAAGGGNGAGCLGQCHNGTLGPKWTAAGALYNRRISGGDPVAGAYVYVIDATGKVIKMTTAQNGFFWTNQPLQEPIRAYATACPDSMPMIANATGNCDQAACHGETNKIYLPGQAPQQ